MQNQIVKDDCTITYMKKYRINNYTHYPQKHIFNIIKNETEI